MHNDPLEHLHFSHEGVRLHAVAAGPADGPLVILLHGFPEFWKSWSRQIAPLARAGFRVIVPDQRGYNLSDKPPRVADYRLDCLAADMVAILDQLGARQACVAGHDWGASVAWWLVTFFPERFRAAAILNVPHPRVMQRHLLRSWRQVLRSWYMFFFQVPGLPERLLARRDWRFAVNLLLGSSRPGTFGREDLEQYRRAWSQPGAMRSMIHWYRAAFRHSRPATEPSSWVTPVPVLILWGEEDRFLGRALGEESLAYCAQGLCEYYPGVSHWIQHEAPERVAQALIGHFSRGGSLAADGKRGP